MVMCVGFIVEGDRLELFVGQIGPASSWWQWWSRPAWASRAATPRHDLLTTLELLGVGHDRHHHAIDTRVQTRLRRFLHDATVASREGRRDRVGLLSRQHAIDGSLAAVGRRMPPPPPQAHTPVDRQHRGPLQSLVAFLLPGLRIHRRGESGSQARSYRLASPAEHLFGQARAAAAIPLRHLRLKRAPQ